MLFSLYYYYCCWLLLFFFCRVRFFHMENLKMFAQLAWRHSRCDNIFKSVIKLENWISIRMNKVWWMRCVIIHHTYTHSLMIIYYIYVLFYYSAHITTINKLYSYQWWHAHVNISWTKHINEPSVDYMSKQIERNHHRRESLFFSIAVLYKLLLRYYYYFIIQNVSLFIYLFIDYCAQYGTIWLYVRVFYLLYTIIIIILHGSVVKISFVHMNNRSPTTIVFYRCFTVILECAHTHR